MSNIALSDKEFRKRTELLNERPARIVFKTALPLLFYSFMKMAFLFFDTLTVSKIDQSMVSTTLFISDIQSLLEFLFFSMSISIGIRISRSFGAGDFQSIRRDLSTIFFTILFISGILVLICTVFSRPILSFFSIPEELLGMGSTYFSISIFSTIFAAVNTLFFASEKARGRTKTVSVCNIMLLVSKLLFNSLVMYLVRSGTVNVEHAIILLPLSVCVSQLMITLVALRALFSKDSDFKVSWKNTSFSREFFVPFIKLMMPILLIKSMTPFSKVICNSQYAVFGSVGLAAYVFSNKICSIVTTTLDALQDAETTVIAANIGNHRYERVRRTVSDSLWLFLAISTGLFTIVSLFSETLMNYFAGNDVELLRSVRTLYLIQRLDFLFMAADSVFTAYLFATKKTKLKTISSFLQKYAVRIPLLYYLINHYGMGIEAIAWSILISNISASLFTFVSYLFITRYYEGKLKANDQAETRLIDAVRTLGRLDALDSNKAGTPGIIVPTDIIELMKENFAVNIETDKLVDEYRFALVEARIDELEKQEII